MRFRVHLFVKVRVEQELEAETPEQAAMRAFDADLDLHRRFDGPDQQFTEEIDDVCLVDPLTAVRDFKGRLMPDEEWSQFLRVTNGLQPDGSWTTIVTPALLNPITYALS